VAVTHVFAGLAVGNYTAAYDWYLRLFGRPADMFPHDREGVWRLRPNGSICLVEDPERAGTGIATLALDDLDAHERRLRDSGLTFAEQAHGTAPRRLVVRDLDGNALTFFQAPGRSGV
jgi:Glyoxalase/Bleomycin resistance protein/Dioxygenase superfamily